MKMVDSTGKKYGRLTAISVAGKKGKNYMWNCLCDCGNTIEVVGTMLRRGNSRSCGCLLSDLNKERGTHNMRHSSEYSSWNMMRQRCNNVNNPAYARYGGRGITVCDEWSTFEGFYKDMGNKPTLQHSLERKDNDKGYSPTNCKWATATEQCNNRSTSCLITYNGETKTLATWSRETGINRATLTRRIFDLKWDMEKALTKGNK